MLGDRGAVREIQKKAANAARSPCFSHKLNSSISKSVKVSLIKKISDNIREVTSFFQVSRPKRNTVLAKFLGKRIVQLCETRWVQRHDAVLQFTIALPDIVKALTRISKWRNRTTAVKASNLITVLCNFEFLMGLFCLSDILCLTQSLSVILQKETIDLPKASEVITTLVATLSERRTHVDDHFDGIFSKATKLAEKLDVEVKKPRTCGRQNHRNNHPSQSCEEYYKVSAYIPLIEMVTEDIKTRFSEDVLKSFNLSLLLPKLNTKLTEKEISELISCLVERFGEILQGNAEQQKMKLRAELALWQQKWKLHIRSGIEIPSTIETLQKCDKDIYPNIHTLLHILCTLPATNASAERSFSSLRRIKTWLRSTMLQERLNGLALLHVNYDIEVTSEEVFERFCKMGKHRINLNL